MIQTGDEVTALVGAADGNRLVFLAACIALAIKLLKHDNAFPLSIPEKWKQWKPWLAVALGIVGGILDHVINGAAWKAAIVSGLVAGMAPVVAHELGKVRK
jgi:hypothetical protein